jgi:7,8-dihydro-6-hydroxymethylpterin-pyrophosphokinase
VRAFLGLGSNIGDRRAHLEYAIDWEGFQVVAVLDERHDDRAS